MSAQLSSGLHSQKGLTLLRYAHSQFARLLRGRPAETLVRAHGTGAHLSETTTAQAFAAGRFVSSERSANRILHVAGWLLRGRSGIRCGDVADVRTLRFGGLVHCETVAAAAAEQHGDGVWNEQHNRITLSIMHAYTVHCI